jgi:hypoxanthine-DNA glycosylase
LKLKLKYDGEARQAGDFRIFCTFKLNIKLYFAQAYQVIDETNSEEDPSLTTPTIKQSFLPVVDRHTRLLILGSLPGDASLAQQQYYAHPQNKFWQLMSEITCINLTTLDYQARLRALNDAGIGLWDVIAQAQRRGSLDSQIRLSQNNDLLRLITNLPQLKGIAFNGATASKAGLKILGEEVQRYRTFSLPSSSPAYTLAYAEKLQAWLALRAVLKIE